ELDAGVVMRRTSGSRGAVGRSCHTARCGCAAACRASPTTESPPPRCGDGPSGRGSAVSDADLEAGERGDLCTGLLRDLRDGLLRVLGERLVQQDVLLEEAVDATLDDLGQRLLGLALLAGGLLGDATLVLDRGGLDLVAGE